MSQQQRIASAATRYAALGWKIVPLWGVFPGGVCECSRGAECSSAGKHPRLDDWGNHASSDEETIFGWAERFPRFNIGLRLGPSSGVIDIEFDSEEGRTTADRLLASVVTPSYRSSRSVHRFFRWKDSLPPKSIRKVFGLECRLGNDVSKSIQSVLPPSQHHTGTLYEWLPGLSPDEVEVADLPDELYAMLVNLDESDTQGTLAEATRATSSGAGRTILRAGGVSEGGDGTVAGRNDTLYRFACREARRMTNPDDPTEVADHRAKVIAVNLAQCHPPLRDVEVETIIASSLAFIRTTPTEREQQGIAMLSFFGLEFTAEKEWWPGSWRLAVRNSDPVSYRLRVPQWDDMTNGKGVILGPEDYLKASKVALAVLCATQTVILEHTPGFWGSVWHGAGGAKDRKPKIGLHKRLMDAMYRETETVDPIEQLGMDIAEYILRKFQNCRNAEEPDHNGFPTKLPDGHIVCKWEKLMEDAYMTRRFTKSEVKRWRLAMEVGRSQQVTVSGHRMLLTFFTVADVSKIQHSIKNNPFILQ